MTSVAEAKNVCKKRKFIETPKDARALKRAKMEASDPESECAACPANHDFPPTGMHEDELCDGCYEDWSGYLCDRCRCFRDEVMDDKFCKECRDELDSACPTCGEIYTPTRPQAGHVCQDEEESSDADDEADEKECSGSCGYPTGKCRCVRLTDGEEAIIARFNDPALRNTDSSVGPDWDKLVSTANIVLAIAKSGQREQNARRGIV